MNDTEHNPADLRPAEPARRQPRHGLRRRTAVIATMGGLTAGAVVGGLIVSHAADSSSTTSASSSAATGGAGGASSSASPSAGARSGSNEDPAHEKNESLQHEADENSGAFHPGGGPRGGWPGGRRGLQAEDLQVVATAIGVSTSQLQTELSGGKTIAAVAKEHNVDVNALISTWVASENKEIDDRVASGALTKAQGDQAKANTQQRVTDLVNGTHTGPRH